MKKIIFIMLLAVASICSGCDKNGGGNAGNSYGFSYQDALTAYDAFNAGLFEQGR